jgi:hypothetical protein
MKALGLEPRTYGLKVKREGFGGLFGPMSDSRKAPVFRGFSRFRIGRHRLASSSLWNLFGTLLEPDGRA